MLASWLLVAGCRRRHEPVDAVRALAAEELGCPLGGVDAVTRGLGNWVAFGCGRRAHYVCGRANCTRHGEVELDPDAGRVTGTATPVWDVGEWACDAGGATVDDARAALRVVGARRDPLLRCGMRTLEARASANDGVLAVASVTGDDVGCLRAALDGAPVPGLGGDVSLRCERR